MDHKELLRIGIVERETRDGIEFCTDVHKRRWVWNKHDKTWMPLPPPNVYPYPANKKGST